MVALAIAQHWSNGGDLVTLVDADQQVVAEESYGEVEEGSVWPCR